MTPIATYYGANRVYQKIPGYEITWSGGSNEPPVDVPKCGFLGDDVKCQTTESFSVVGMIFISIGSMMVIVGVAVILIYRKMKLESEINDSWWKVDWDQIRIVDKGAGRKSTVSLGASQATLTSAATRSVSGLSSINSSMNTTLGNVHGVLVGTYKVNVSNL